MGRLVDGEWVTDDRGTDSDGRYVRRPTQFRDRIERGGTFPPEPGRYHLYVAHACPWCHRTMMARKLKGLEDVIGVSFVEPFMGADGWVLPEGADPVFGHGLIRDVYVSARGDYTGRASVPVLIDRETKTIVNNESSDIIRMFDEAFESAEGAVTLFPEDLADVVEAQIAANYDAVNNGVYRAGFAGSQAAHEEAVTALFARMDALEELLATSRYLCGERLTAADVCLFPTLYRFDAVYATHFKCNLRRLVDYEHLWAYTRDIYQVLGVAETCVMSEIKEHYYRSHESINPRRLVPLGPVLDFDAPHHRQRR